MLTSNKNYFFYLILFFYTLIFGSILYVSNGIPYVFDNNESFSAWWHAYNSINFGFSNSYGLADESFSYDIEAHPFAYTHAGTMPRIWVEGLFRLGFNSIESQIFITCFSIGLMAIIFCWSFFKSVSNRYIGFIYIFLLITNYVAYSQWHIGNWQIWKTFFLFGVLLIICNFRNNDLFKRKIDGVLIAIFLFFLYYYEHVFSFFILITSFLYLIIFKNKKIAFKWITFNLIIGIFTAIILISQVIFYLGFDSALKDIFFTFIGRNYSSDPDNFIKEAQDFYNNQDIAFWMNVPDSSITRSFSGLKNLLTNDFNLIGPQLTGVFLFGYYYSILIIYKKKIKNFLLKYLKFNQELILNIFLCGFILFITFLSVYLLDKNYILIWNKFYDYNNLYSTFIILSILTIFLSIDNKNSLTNHIPKIKKLILFSLTFFISMLITFYIFSGYVTTGYVVRHAPFSIYVSTLISSISVFFYGGILINSLKLYKTKNFYKITLFFGSSIIVALIYIWISIQVYYSKAFHPNNLGFKDIISSDSLRGSSVVGQMYGGTTAYFTKKWSYLETDIEKFIPINKDEEKYYERNKNYQWFADKQSNEDYNYPEYYLLFKGYSIGDLIYQIHQNNINEKITRVSSSSIITFLNKIGQESHGMKIVAQDKTGQDRWALIKLDWGTLE